MTDTNQHTRQHTQDSFVTVLDPAERVAGAVSRKVAFGVLAVVAVVACALAVCFWYLWITTVRTCIDTYILHNTTSALLDPDKAKSLQDYLSGLDISSFSALILALLFTRMAIVGVRNTLLNLHRDGESYFARAYQRVLFPEVFESLCIRLGLLGTLLSFLLAAISQMGNVSVAGPVDHVPTLEQQVAVVSSELTEDGEPKPANSMPVRGAKTTSQLSSQMFLLLCASLVSTFVGTGVAYVVTPSLNWLNDRAVGRHQVHQSDPAFAAEEFFRQIDRTSQRLSQFEKTTVKIAESAEHISNFERNIASASKGLADLLNGIEKTIHLFEVSNHNGQQLAEKLEHVEELSDRLCRLLRQIPDKLNSPLENVSKTAIRFQEATLSGKAAFSELKEAAETARGSLAETEHRTNVNWRMLKEVRDALRELAESENMQTSQIAGLTSGVEHLGGSLESLIKEVEALLRQYTHQKNADGGVVRSLAAIQAQLVDMANHSTDEREVNDSATSRSWWQRLFE